MAEVKRLNSSALSHEVIQSAIKHNAASLLLAHNHPWGNHKPSLNDKELTKNMVYTASIMDKVLDPIMISNNTYFSIADEGLIEEYRIGFLN